MKFLTLETTCDETAAAVVTEQLEVLGSVVASQDDLHERFGGVVPEIASRAHVERILPVIDEALRRAGVRLADLDAVAVANTPGLAGSLLVGLVAAKTICVALGIPLIAVNHLQAHIYACRLASREEVFPCVGLIISGGHTCLYRCQTPLDFELLGATVDDAAGEAFDKVGRLLGLPFPGGPNIERAALNGNAAAYAFPRAKRDDSYDFSFSGLKTAVMREATVMPASETTRRQRGAEKKAQLRSGISIADVAASFQQALVDTLVDKTVRAAKAFGATEILMAGGVSANQALRRTLLREAGLPVRYPPLNLCTDNAAMIAAAGHYRYEAGLRCGLDIEALPMWPLTSETYSAAS